MKQRALVIGVWATLALAGLWFLLSHVVVTTRLDAFLPVNAPDAAEKMQHYALQSRVGEHLILAAITDAPVATLVALSKQFTIAATAVTGVARIDNQPLKPSAKERELLLRYRYLLSGQGDDDTFTAAGLTGQLTTRYRELRSTLPMVDKSMLARDPTHALAQLLAAWRADVQPAIRDSVWIDTESQRALLLVTLSSQPRDIEAKSRLIADLQTIFQSVATGSSAQLLLTGPLPFAVVAKTAIEGESKLLSLLASLALALLLWWGFRRPTPVLLAALPLLSGTLGAAAITQLYFGHIQGITLAFGATLLGIAIDYPLHLLAHARATESLASSYQRIWPTLRLGLVTTVIAYASLYTTPYLGLQQLALFTVTGLGVAIATTRWLLPALSCNRDCFAPVKVRRLPEPVWRVVALLGVLAVPTALALHQGPIWESDLAAMNPLPRALVAQDRILRAALGAPEVSHALVVSGDSVEQVLQRCDALLPELDALRRDQLIRGYDALCRYLPSVATQTARAARLPDAARLQQLLATATAEVPFRPESFAPFVADVAASRQLPPLTPAQLAATALQAKSAQLLIEGERQWHGLVTLSDVDDSAALRNRHAGWAVEAVQLLNLKRDTELMLAEFRSGALQRLAIAALIILVMLAISLRDLRRWLRVVAPLTLALTITVSLLLLWREQLNLFHLFALILVAGLGADYALFFSRRETDQTDHRANRTGVLICAASTISVFAIISQSTYAVLATIGETVALGAALSYLYARVFATHEPPPNRAETEEPKTA